MLIEKKINIDQLKAGDTLCYQSKGIISFFIRLFTNSKFSHTSIYVVSGLVGEAVKDGYVVHDIKESIKGAKRIIVKRPLFDFNKAKFTECIFDLLRARYEFEGLLYEAMKQVKPNSKWKGDKEAFKDVFCSKANAYIFYNIFGLQDYENWFETTPRDIAEDFKNFESFELELPKK